MRRFITIGIFAVLLLGIGTAAFLANRTVKNDPDDIGNTACNLLNGGLFCEDGDKIYFSNPDDNGALYVMNSDMSNLKMLYNDNCTYINTTNHYVVYVRENHKRTIENSDQFLNLNSTGVYRVDKKNGKNIKQLYQKPAGLTSLKGNYVYYQHYNPDEGLHFYQIMLDGSKEKKISEEAIIPSSILGNTMYYNGVGEDHNIYTMSLPGGSSSLLYEGNCYYPVATSQYIYFLSLSNHYAIVRMNLDGTNPEFIVKERCSFFNLSPDEKYLYYQVDGGDNNRLCRMNLDTLTSEVIREGDFNSIHVTKNYVFFKEFSSNQIFYITSATGAIEPFSPGKE